MLKKIVAVIAGVVTAGVVIALIEMIGHAVFPPPVGVDFADPVSVSAMMQAAPIGALLFVIVAWLAGIVAGATIAFLIVRENGKLNASIVGGLVLAGTIANLLMIPHPVWFSVVSVVAIIVTTALTVIVFGNRQATRHAG